MNESSAFAWDPRILRSLQYFEAVARLGTVAAAAAELGVSPSAVSHQLRSLSAYIGEELFTKSGRGLILSERGSRLQAQVAAAFSHLGTALSDAIGERKSHLRLGVCSSFGLSWLTQRLPEFFARNPGINIELRLNARDPEQTEAVADAVVTADAVSEGFEAVTLFEEMLVAVARPGIALSRQELPEVLITTDVPPAVPGLDWRALFALTGRDSSGLPEHALVRCTHYVLALALAKAGVGAALVPDFVAAEALAAGQVALLDPTRLPSGRVYRICYKVSRRSDPDLRALVRWMKSSADRPGSAI